jgi:hypothetical protein
MGSFDRVTLLKLDKEKSLDEIETYGFFSKKPILWDSFTNIAVDVGYRDQTSNDMIWSTRR